MEEAERRASEEYIQRLLAEEEEPLAEAKRRQEEQQLENDERLARLLSQQLVRSHITQMSYTGVVWHYHWTEIQRFVMQM